LTKQWHILYDFPACDPNLPEPSYCKKHWFQYIGRIFFLCHPGGDFTYPTEWGRMGSSQQVLLLAISQVYSLWCYVPILRLYQTRFPFLPLNNWLSSSKRCIWCGELPTVETVLIKRSMRGTSWNKVFGHLPLNLGIHSTFKLCRSVRPLFAFLLHLATHLPFFPLKFHQTSSAKKTQTQLQLTPNHPSWFIQLPSIQPSFPPSVDWLANSTAHPTPKKSSFPWHCHTSIFSGLTSHLKVHPSW
jgi:hypothetical protein